MNLIHITSTNDAIEYPIKQIIDLIKEAFEMKKSNEIIYQKINIDISKWLSNPNNVMDDLKSKGITPDNSLFMITNPTIGLFCNWENTIIPIMEEFINKGYLHRKLLGISITRSKSYVNYFLNKEDQILIGYDTVVSLSNNKEWAFGNIKK